MQASRSSASIPDRRYVLTTIQASTLAGLVDYASSLRHNADAWFADTTLTAGQCFDPDARLSFREAALIIRRALQEFPGTGLGLAVGSRVTLPALGVLGFSVMSSATVGDAVTAGQKYHPVTGSLMDVSCRMADGEFVLEALERFDEPAILEFLCEKFFASTVSASRALLGSDYRPLRLELRYTAPPYESEYRRLFRCPVIFSTSHNRMVVDPRLLGRKIQTQSTGSHAEALRLCTSKMPVLPAPDLIESLRCWLRERLARSPRITDAACDLQVGERTLRRRLSDAGTSFRKIHDGLRAERAQVLLRDRRLGIAEIGYALGFSEDREFRRAYKRWTGKAPSAVRGVAHS